ncbi:MAG: transporter substrate-binding domain-containing protein, partial [Halioglobus sp.]
MSSKSGKMHTTIRLTVVSVFIVATAMTAVVAIGLQYYFSEKMAREAAADLYSATATSVASELNAIGRVNANIIDLLADNPDLGDPDREAALIKIFVQVLEKNPLLYGIYVGRSDGSLFEVINLNTSDQARNKMLALPPDEWLVMVVRSVDGAQQRSYQYLDANLQERVSRSESTDYDAAQRPWYQAALLSGEVEVSKPYLFAQLGSAGRTVSKRIVGSDSVVGIDMTLASISKFLSDQQIAGDSGVYLYDAEGNVIASNFIEESKQPALPIPNVQISQQERDYLNSLGTLTVSNELNWPPIDYAQRGEPRGYSIDIVRMIAGALDVPVAFENGFTWSELVDRFREGKIKLLHPVALTEENRDWGRSGDSHFRLPFALVTKEGAEQPVSLNQLIGKNLAIPSGW